MRLDICARRISRLVSGTLWYLAACHDAGTSPDRAPQAIVVEVDGLPAGISADITLTSPSGTAQRVRESSRIGTLLTGSWRLEARPVSSTSATWLPSVALIDSTLATGDTLFYAIHYTRTGSAFTTLVTGLPSGAGGAVTVWGPDSSRRTITRDTILTALDSGTYVIRADTLLVNGLRYAPTPLLHVVSVSPALSTVTIKVTYLRALPVLDVRVTGLPPGTVTSLRVGDASGTRTVPAVNAQTLSLQPGAVSITALPAEDSQGHAYAAETTPVARTLPDGTRDSITVRYARTLGTLLVNVHGLPQGTEAAIALTGSGYASAVSGLSTMDLAPGPYTVRAFPVTVGGARYTPQPATVTLDIHKGDNIPATVLYANGAAPAFNVEVDGAYLTQVIQQPDGTLPLVAGREALLRVFAHANFSNNAGVPVRARLYQSTTLVSTVMLTALPAVPPTVSEGTLSSSWNAIIPAARLQPGLRLLVDIDPGNTLGEVNREDNVWPRNGVPQPIDVRVAPPFVVRFVPIVINAVPGAVSVADRESFFTLARRLHPLLEISSDVHAPFTSAVRNPLLVDGLTLWGSLLSELEALRVVEGATANYFGVVNAFYSKGIAGIALTGGPVALGYDQPERRALTAAHEWGHNFGRMHAPCGNPSLPDPDFPNGGGLTGNWGYDALAHVLVSPRSTDVMAYCDDVWMSGWTWSNEIAFRERASVLAASRPASATASDAPSEASTRTSSGLQKNPPRTDAGDGLLVWGRIVDGQVTIEPAFRVHAPIAPVPVTAAHWIDITDANGTLLASRPVEATVASDVPGHELRIFAVVIPWHDTLETHAAVIRMRTTGNPLATTERVANAGITSTNARILVRDSETGQVIGFFTGELPSVMRSRRTVEAIISDGVRSRRLRLP